MMRLTQPTKKCEEQFRVRANEDKLTRMAEMELSVFPKFRKGELPSMDNTITYTCDCACRSRTPNPN